MRYLSHAATKKLLKSGSAEGYAYYDDWNGTAPALVFFFRDRRPVPISEEHWPAYQKIIEELRLKKLDGGD